MVGFGITLSGSSMYVVQITMKILLIKESKTVVMQFWIVAVPEHSENWALLLIHCRVGTTVFSEVFAISTRLFSRSLKIGDYV